MGIYVALQREKKKHHRALIMNYHCPPKNTTLIEILKDLGEQRTPNRDVRYEPCADPELY